MILLLVVLYVLLDVLFYFALCLAVSVAVIDRLVSWITGYPPIFRLCTRWRWPGRAVKDGVTIYNFGWLRVVPWRWKA